MLNKQFTMILVFTCFYGICNGQIYTIPSPRVGPIIRNVYSNSKYIFIQTQYNNSNGIQHFFVEMDGNTWKDVTNIDAFEPNTQPTIAVINDTFEITTSKFKYYTTNFVDFIKKDLIKPLKPLPN